MVEGYLKKLKKYLLSDKYYFRVIGTQMFRAATPKKPFVYKYDLTDYDIKLSTTDNCKFYFEPNDPKLGLKVMKFVCENPNGRAYWYKNLLSIMLPS